MAITFLHTSDWHIGKPFGRFDDARAAILRRARLDAIDRLAQLGMSAGARSALVAGDVFDRPNLSDRDVREPLGQMRAHAGITWHIIPGNHDPAITGGIWDRIARDGLPANVRLHLAPGSVEIEPGCFLLPAPLTAKAVSRDPTLFMDETATPEGALRIGLAHGSIQGFGSKNDAAVMIAPDRARRAGLDYLALGDWHGTLKIGSHAAYSGTPEPDGYLDNDAGGALLVTIEGHGAAPRIERHATGQYEWAEHRLDVMRATDIDALEGSVEAWGPRARGKLLSLRLAGPIGLADLEALRHRLARIDARLFVLETNEEDLRVVAADSDLDSLSDAGLAALATSLAAGAQSRNAHEAAVAARALRHLFHLATEATGAAGRGPA